jgi:hypothetical protein
MEIILYIIIGLIIGLCYYVYKCHKYKKKYKTKSLKPTWDEYDDNEGISITLVICIFTWPLAILAVLTYFIFVYPTVYIRKYFGIE